MTMRIRGSELLAASVASVAFALAGCRGGGGGDVSGGGDNQQAAFNFDETNMRYGAGAAARAIDAFAPLADLMDKALTTLWQPGVQSGQQAPLPACFEGSATFTWTDVNGDGAFSSGDTVVLAPRSCRVHAGDAEVLTGDVGLTFTSVSRGPPRAVVAVMDSGLGVQGGAIAGTIRGRANVTATSPDGLRHSFTFQPAGTALLSITGPASFDFGCFDVRNDYDPALGFVRRIAILGTVRTLGKVMSFSPGAKLLYRSDDVPGDGAVEVLSFMVEPSCPALGIEDGVGNSDHSGLTISPGAVAGEMRLELHRSGQAVRSDSCSWSELLHPAVPHQGIIDGTNAVAVASAAVSLLALPSDVGALATDLVLGVYRGSPVPLCTSGAYSVSPPPTLGVGQTVMITFSSCATSLLGPQVTLGGSAPLTVTAVGGQPSGGAYSLSADIGPVDVTTSSPGEASRVTGSFRFSRTAAGDDVTQRSDAPPGGGLAIAETSDGVTAERQITAFSVTAATTASGGFTFASAGDAATVATGDLAGDLAVNVSGAVRGSGQAPPSSGELKISAADATSLTLRVGAGGAVELGLDGDGDGSVDAMIQTTWSELR